ncbi:MAG: sulfatase-like hydrolase/transferase [Desulfomonile tiedjei]|uniref:Sulfatase-like hydrolase/transferase n=1 Tax=Desulfomonile tiedjei TaxID=2358 RepID=A0A9D6V0D1_9BACT|nr:sulfatase-like hydrolase/transferase [Desulfomonile tiedjei]
MTARVLWRKLFAKPSLPNATSGQVPDSGQSPVSVWLTILLFLTVSSDLFVWFFEWERYQIITGARWQAMSLLDKVLIFWLLAAKSLAWFLPLLLASAAFISFGLKRMTVVIVNLFWILIFYFFAIDLVCVSFAGYHSWDYMPHIQDMLENPDQKIWQWAGERLTTEAAMIFGIFLVAGPACYLCIRRVSTLLIDRLAWLNSRAAAMSLTGVFLGGVLGVAPLMSLFNDQHALDRIYGAMPLTTGIRECFLWNYADRVASETEKTRTGPVSASLSAMGHPLALNVAQHLTVPKNCIPKGWGLFPAVMEGGPQSADGGRQFSDQESSWFDLFGPRNVFSGLFSKMEIELAAARNLFHPTVANLFRTPAFGQPTQRPYETHEGIAAQHYEPEAMKLVRDSADPAPEDPSAYVAGPELPNVIMIIFESLRHNALGPGLMKDLDAWSKQGLRLQRHYSGSNCSHLGLFSLFYSRIPLGYHQTLDRKIPSQMLESLRRSGYQITFLTSGEVKGFRRLDQFINEKSCDKIVSEGEFTLAGMKDWPDSDRRKLHHVRKIMNKADTRPQFVFFYLVSSHYRYAFPPEFEIFKETPSIWQFLNPWSQIENHMNRYSNALLFLEQEVMQMLKSIDPKRNIVMITGDHGESMGEDGVFTHATRMSEIQLRVPFAMVGAGVEPREVTTATVHTDVLPTLLHVLAGKNVPIGNCHGRDLLAADEPADEVVLVPANGPKWEGFMIVRGDKRIALRTSTSSREASSMEFTGLLDESGLYELKVGQDEIRYPLKASH